VEAAKPNISTVTFHSPAGKFNSYVPSSAVEVAIFSAPRSAVTVAPGTGRVCARTTPRSRNVSGCADNAAQNAEIVKNVKSFTKGILREDYASPAAGSCNSLGYLFAAMGGVAILLEGAAPRGISMAGWVSPIFFKFAAWINSAETKNLPVLFIEVTSFQLLHI